MEHYVTLFNSLFLPQGLALHMSMERQIKEYTLWILCVDDETFKVLTRLNLPNVRLLQLSKLETSELLEVKADRTIGEYCWTLTPYALRFVFEADSEVARVTYIDADLWFRKNPAPIFREFDDAKKFVLITDHAYAPEYDQSETSGTYCVQFIVFTRHGGEPVRKWWEERCIEWCYDKHEDGKFGDQKYLDDWPERFINEVHVLCNKDFALAPWNAIRFPYGQAIFYHFHGLRITANGFINIGNYLLPTSLIDNLYRPYLKDIELSKRILFDLNYVVKPQALRVGYIDSFHRRLIRIYNLLRFYLQSENL